MRQIPQYITDSEGQRVGVVLDVAEYEALWAAQRELEAIRTGEATRRRREEHVALERMLFEMQG